MALDLLGSAVGWPDVAIALIAAIPAIIAALYSHRNNRALQTGNAKTVGEMVTEGHGRLSTEATEYDTQGPPPPVGNDV